MPAPPAPDAWSVRTHVEHRQAATTLVIAGRLGTAGAAAVRDALSAVATPGRVVHLDLSGVDYVSSAGLAVLRDAKLALDGSGGSLVVASESEIVTLALRLAGGL